MSTTADELSAWLAEHGAPASDAETLALKPNAIEAATSGPHEPVDPNRYVHMTKPDGTEFLAPKANVEHYEHKGFTAGAEEVIEDLVAYWAAKAQAEPAAAPEPEPEPKPTSKSSKAASNG